MSDRDILHSMMRGRRSVRRFRDEPIGREMFLQLVEAASWAPSASNRQDWRFVIVSSAGIKRDMADAVRAHWASILDGHDDSGGAEAVRAYTGNFDWFAHAPAVVAVTAKEPELFLEQILHEAADSVAGTYASACMAAQNMMLAAHAHGIGSCCLTGPVAAGDALKKILKIGKRRKIVCLIAMGYPVDASPAPPRKGAMEIARFMA